MVRDGTVECADGLEEGVDVRGRGMRPWIVGEDEVQQVLFWVVVVLVVVGREELEVECVGRLLGAVALLLHISLTTLNKYRLS